MSQKVTSKEYLEEQAKKQLLEIAENESTTAIYLEHNQPIVKSNEHQSHTNDSNNYIKTKDNKSNNDNERQNEQNKQEDIFMNERLKRSSVEKGVKQEERKYKLKEESEKQIRLMLNKIVSQEVIEHTQSRHYNLAQTSTRITSPLFYPNQINQSIQKQHNNNSQAHPIYQVQQNLPSSFKFKALTKLNQSTHYLTQFQSQSQEHPDDAKRKSHNKELNLTNVKLIKQPQAHKDNYLSIPNKKNGNSGLSYQQNPQLFHLMQSAKQRQYTLKSTIIQKLSKIQQLKNKTLSDEVSGKRQFDTSDKLDQQYSLYIQPNNQMLGISLEINQEYSQDKNKNENQIKSKSVERQTIQLLDTQENKSLLIQRKQLLEIENRLEAQQQLFSTQRRQQSFKVQQTYLKQNNYNKIQELAIKDIIPNSFTIGNTHQHYSFHRNVNQNQNENKQIDNEYQGVASIFSIKCAFRQNQEVKQKQKSKWIEDISQDQINQVYQQNNKYNETEYSDNTESVTKGTQTMQSEFSMPFIDMQQQSKQSHLQNITTLVPKAFDARRQSNSISETTHTKQLCSSIDAPSLRRSSHYHQSQSHFIETKSLLSQFNAFKNYKNQHKQYFSLTKKSLQFLNPDQHQAMLREQQQQQQQQQYQEEQENQQYHPLLKRNKIFSLVNKEYQKQHNKLSYTFDPLNIIDNQYNIKSIKNTHIKKLRNSQNSYDELKELRDRMEKNQLLKKTCYDFNKNQYLHRNTVKLRQSSLNQLISHL